MSRATLDKQPHEVAAMFDAVARRYDLMNDLMSLGQDRIWRAVVARTVGASAGQRVLDLAAGTGTSSASFTKGGAVCVACDFSLGMLRVGAARNLPGVGFVAGDALALPFADASFDATTISFGLRNVHDVPAALAEMARVTKPGGRLVICEFSRPTIAPLRAAYHLYLRNAMPALARVSSNPESYRYLAESILAWPDQPSLARMIGDAGWQRPQWRNLSTGIVAIHRAVRADHAGRPADPERGTSSKLA